MDPGETSRDSAKLHYTVATVHTLGLTVRKYPIWERAPGIRYFRCHRKTDRESLNISALITNTLPI